VLYEQSVDDIDGWIKDIESQIVTEDVGHDLTTVNLLVQKQNILEVSERCTVLSCIYLSSIVSYVQVTMMMIEKNCDFGNILIFCLEYFQYLFTF